VRRRTTVDRSMPSAYIHIQVLQIVVLDQSLLFFRWLLVLGGDYSLFIP
jgi:hypothetical protein